MAALRVLVTGAGSGVGQGILKSLRLSTLDLHLISSDAEPISAGLSRTADALVLPKVEAAGSLEAYLSAIEQARVDAVLVGSEFDLRFFAEHKDTIKGGIDKAADVAKDKVGYDEHVDKGVDAAKGAIDKLQKD